MGGRCRKIHWPNQRCNVHTQHQCMPKRHFKMAIPQCRLGMAREWKHLYSMCLIEIKLFIKSILFCTYRFSPVIFHLLNLDFDIPSLKSDAINHPTFPLLKAQLKVNHSRDHKNMNSVLFPPF